MDTSFASFGLGMKELWLNLYNMSKLKVHDLEFCIIGFSLHFQATSPSNNFLKIKKTIVRGLELMVLIKT